MYSISKLTVYVICKDRLKFTIEAIESLTNQIYKNFELVISDNSVSDDIYHYIRDYHPNVNYVRRFPSVSAEQHFRMVFDECHSEYVMFFHDDDILLKEHISELIKVLDKDHAIVAASANAYIKFNDELSGQKTMRFSSQDRMITSKEQIFNAYFDICVNGPPPFSGYIYRTRSLKGVYIDSSEAGKYSDVTFLVKLLDRGCLFWISRPLMVYRIHGGSDSLNVNLKHKLMLMRYLIRHSKLGKKSNLITSYRFSLYFYLLSNNFLSPRRKNVVLKFMFNKSILYGLTSLGFWYRAVHVFKSTLLKR